MLSDHNKRQYYNLYGVDGPDPEQQPNYTAQGVVCVTPATGQRHSEVKFGHFWFAQSASAGACNAGAQPQQWHGTQGKSVEAMLALTFMEAALGTERTFQASVRLQCPDCGGCGLSSTSQPVDCTGCKGTGQKMRCHTTSLGKSCWIHLGTLFVHFLQYHTSHIS